MNRKLLIWLGVIILLSIGYLIYKASGQPTDDQQPSNIPQSKNQPLGNLKSEVQAAPDFTLIDLGGKTVSLSDFKGKNVYLNFWASWCGPCKLEMPDLEKIYQEFKDKDLIVLAVNVGENKSKVEAFVTSNGYSFPVLLDIQGKAAQTYKVSSIPVSVFVNKEGLIVAKRIGLMTYSQMEASISELLK